jgi:formylglycine-generating enzyme required for sulfatase activity
VRLGLSVFIAALASWLGLQLGSGFLPEVEPAPEAMSEDASQAGHRESGFENDPSEHPEAVYQGARVQPSNDPIIETWEDQYFPFLGFEPEIGSADQVKETKPSAKREFPSDSMVFIPAGNFTLGDDRIPGARPGRRAYLDAFFIDRYEVSNARYEAFVKATGRRAPYVHENWAAIYNWFKDTHPTGLGETPVVLVTWKDADAFCRWAGLRLPSEYEWEKAARGSNGRLYPWGNTWDSRLTNVVSRISGPLSTVRDWDEFEAGWTGSKKPEIHPIGSYPRDRSVYGVMDMAGNVSEWVAGRFVPYEGAVQSDSPAFGKKYRLARGNSWGNRDYSTSLAVRYPYEEERVDSVIGIRCARSLKAGEQPPAVQ